MCNVRTFPAFVLFLFNVDVPTTIIISEGRIPLG